MVSEVGSKLSL